MTELRPDNMTRPEEAGDRAVYDAYPPWLKERLAWFQDLRFGLFIHWGLWAQWGCTESWPLVKEEPWARPPHLPAWADRGFDFERFQRDYFALNRTFDPRGFDPEHWVEAARAGGMKYLCFAVKHHDGFCLFDTRTTEYRTTHPSCPFHDHAHADVARSVFHTFREAGFALSCYFSKSDWHCPWYWSREPGDPPAVTRNPNYDPRRRPERWERFVRFTHTQVEELVTRYGPFDVLWLDGGQVRPPEQDLRMDELVTLARRHLPELLVADRTVGGEHENILTPEQQVPDTPPGRPWETCITAGTAFAWKANDEYKSPRTLVHLLADVAAKGGNLLLGVGPDGQGRIPEEALDRFAAVGRWLERNGEAIFGTRGAVPFRQSDEVLEMRFTRRRDTLYALVLAKPGQPRPTRIVPLRGLRPEPGSAVFLLGFDRPLAWRVEGADTLVEMPTAFLEARPPEPAWTIKVERVRGEPASKE